MEDETESRIVAYIRKRAQANRDRSFDDLAQEVATEFDALASDIAAGMHR